MRCKLESFGDAATCVMEDAAEGPDGPGGFGSGVHEGFALLLGEIKPVAGCVVNLHLVFHLKQNAAILFQSPE